MDCVSYKLNEDNIMSKDKLITLINTISAELFIGKALEIYNKYKSEEFNNTNLLKCKHIFDLYNKLSSQQKIDCNYIESDFLSTKYTTIDEKHGKYGIIRFSRDNRFAIKVILIEDINSTLKSRLLSTIILCIILSSNDIIPKINGFYFYKDVTDYYYLCIEMEKYTSDLHIFYKTSINTNLIFVQYRALLSKLFKLNLICVDLKSLNIVINYLLDTSGLFTSIDLKLIDLEFDFCYCCTSYIKEELFIQTNINLLYLDLGLNNPDSKDEYFYDILFEYLVSIDYIIDTNDKSDFVINKIDRDKYICIYKKFKQKIDTSPLKALEFLNTKFPGFEDCMGTIYTYYESIFNDSIYGSILINFYLNIIFFSIFIKYDTTPLYYYKFYRLRIISENASKKFTEFKGFILTNAYYNSYLSKIKTRSNVNQFIKNFEYVSYC